jgi:hypothetical protein
MIERVRIFKVGGLWFFKHFFPDKVYKELSTYYNKREYRFECATTAGRNRVHKFLEKNGFEVEIIDNLDGFLVSVNAGEKYASILRNSIAHKRVGGKIVFLLKDKNAVEAALRKGAELYHGGVSWD